jgi:hypothetical protein
MSEERKINGHGGRRKGAGRKRGSRTVHTTVSKFILADEARKYAQEALTLLVRLMEDKRHPGTTRLAAAKELLDRGYGKPTIQVQAETNVRGPAWWADRLAELDEADVIRVIPKLRFGTADDGGQ